MQMECQSVTRLRSPNLDGMEVEASGYRNCYVISVISVIMVDGIVFTWLEGAPKRSGKRFQVPAGRCPQECVHLRRPETMIDPGSEMTRHSIEMAAISPDDDMLCGMVAEKWSQPTEENARLCIDSREYTSMYINMLEACMFTLTCRTRRTSVVRRSRLPRGRHGTSLVTGVLVCSCHTSQPQAPSLFRPRHAMK